MSKSFLVTVSEDGVVTEPKSTLVLLGPVEITNDGAPLVFAYDKVLALLVYLAVESDRAHRRTALANLLWPEQPKHAARHSLSQALFLLRQMFYGDADNPILLVTRDTLRFNQTSDMWIDVAAFRTLLERSTNGDLQLIEQAIGLYRGDFLEEQSTAESAEFGEWALLTREQLRNDACQVLRRLTEPVVWLRDATKACGYAQRWLELDPLCEEAYRRHMALLARTGQHTAALVEFERCRELLESELGIAPEPATLALYEELKGDSPAAQLTMPLPQTARYAFPFVGRTKELVDIGTRLANPECRLLTVIGLGGSGKTRLAVESATAVARQFPNGAVFVALQPLARSDLLVSTIAQAVGLTFYGEGDLQQQLLDYLREKTLLLILDNFEHVLDGAALISIILARAPGITILVTSREALNLQEEWLYPLKGMSAPQSVYASSLEDYEAVQLFLFHARRVQPNFDLTSEHDPVIRICTMTAGLPLAIELAASWLKGSSAAQIAREMQCNLDFLSTTTRNIEERHRSMRAVFDQSWKLLSEHERLIFARLSLFTGGFDADAAHHVAETSFASLATMVEKSLVQMDSSDRFGIHELLRQYGVEKLAAYGETAPTYARHSQYFAQLMLQREAALQQPQQEATIQAIERDFENIRLAWEWSTKNQHVADLNALLHGLYLFGFLRSRYRETTAMFQHALEQPVADQPLLGRLLARRWGCLHWLYQADYGKALTNIEQSLAIAVAENNQFEIAFCHLMAAYAMISTERYTEALPHLETSQALFEAIHEPYYVCWVTHRLGYIHYTLHNSARANEYTEQSLALARAAYNPVALVICLYNLGSAYILNGDYVKGKQHCAEALQVATEAGHQDQIAHALSLLALCAFCQGDYSTCQSYAERSRIIIETINSFVFEPYSLSVLILLACLHEDYAEGVRLNRLAKSHSTNKMGLQLLYWALAVLSCGQNNAAEANINIQNVLQLADPDLSCATILWIVPCAAYTLAETDPGKAIELIAWVWSYDDTALNWVRQWPLFDRLHGQLQAAIDAGSYRLHWENGQACTFAGMKAFIYHAFCASPDTETEVSFQPLLTARENEILGLMATGMTNPQIAAQVIIGAGTVKTHTLNIYRKLEVANRTQAIIRAQELGLLHS